MPILFGLLKRRTVNERSDYNEYNGNTVSVVIKPYIFGRNRCDVLLKSYYPIKIQNIPYR